MLDMIVLGRPVRQLLRDWMQSVRRYGATYLAAYLFDLVRIRRAEGAEGFDARWGTDTAALAYPWNLAYVIYVNPRFEASLRSAVSFTESNEEEPGGGLGAGTWYTQVSRNHDRGVIRLDQVSEASIMTKMDPSEERIPG